MPKYHIYIFRHGQTYFNRDHRFTGWKDSKLTPLGKKQAKKIAEKLKNKKIDVAYTSDLSRCKDTLKEILRYHSECREKIVDKRLRERSYGKLEGKHHLTLIKETGTRDYKTLLHWHKIDHLHGKEKEEFVKKHGEADLQIIRRSYTNKPPGGENMPVVEKRVNAFIKGLLKKIRKEKVNVAISASGNSMRPFRRHFEHLTTNQMMKLENPWDDYFEYVVEVK